MDGLTALDIHFGPISGAMHNIVFHFISGGRDLECFGPPPLPPPPTWRAVAVNEDRLLVWIHSFGTQEFYTNVAKDFSHLGSFRGFGVCYRTIGTLQPVCVLL